MFVHAMRKLPQLRDPRCFAGWLRRITARMAINRLTRRGPLRGADPELLDAVAGRTAGPLEELDAAEAVGRCTTGWRELKAAGPGRRWRRSTSGAGALKQMGREFDDAGRHDQAAAARRPAAAEGGAGGGVDGRGGRPPQGPEARTGGGLIEAACGVA